MTELHPDAKALFEGARAALDPPDGAEARVFAKLGAATGLSAAALAGSTSAAASQPAGALLAKLGGGLWLVPKTYAVSLSVIALGSTAVVAGAFAQRHVPAPSHVAAAAVASARHNVGARANAAPSAARSSETLDRAPSSVAPTTPVTPKVASHAAASALSAEPRAPLPAAESAPRDTLATGSAAFDLEAEAPSPPPRDTQTNAEIALIREMQAAWRAGQDSRLASAIAAHRSRFPQGMLSEEREALSAMLECRQSPQRASSIGARFSTRFARSPYQARVDSACRTGSNEEK